MEEKPSPPAEFTGRRVYVAFRVIQVGTISEPDQCFKARFDMFVEWYDPEAALFDVSDLETYRKRHWEPLIRFSNADEFAETKRLYMAWRDTGFVGFRSTVQGIFRVGFELSMFPFDVQALTVEITVGRERGTQELLHLQKMQFRASPNHPNVLMRQCSTEWQFRPPRFRVKRTTALEGVDGHEMAQYVLVLPIQRSFGYYLYNVYVVAGLIQVMGFGVYAMEISKVADRLMLAATLLLLMVALKFTLLQHQPNISYMTHLDKYMVSSYFMLVVTYAHTAIFYATVSRLGKDDEECRSIESYFVICLVVIFIVLQLCFVRSAWRSCHSQHQRISEFGSMDDRLKELLCKQGYEMVNGVVKGSLVHSEKDLFLPDDLSPAAKEEHNLARRNSWNNGERYCARRSMSDQATESSMNNIGTYQYAAQTNTTNGLPGREGSHVEDEKPVFPHDSDVGSILAPPPSKVNEL